ncbi:MAG TPA: hypothetical protein VEV43_08725, partial [Actinomycetota bacterium]|nr:hypothetical protein [Actinomycetota bacterium]
LQKKVADTLRWVAILIGLAASGLAVWTVLAAADTTSVARLVGKVVAAIALYGVAGYVASQSAAHRRREEHAKRRELDLVAFGPFIADLEEPDRQLARKELVAKLFGNDALDDEKKGGVLTQENVGLLGQLWEIFSKSRK